MVRLSRSFRGPLWLRRCFSTTGANGASLKINPDRLQETLHHTCQWGQGHRYGSGANDTGMSRLALSDDDARVRRWFAQETESLGCTVTVDEVGNMFARQRGSLASSSPMTAMGSHLDTQPRGGRFDGILGIIAAVEALRTLKENGYQTSYDVGVVNWTNEEGARFPKSMMGSVAWAGHTPVEKVWDFCDIFDPATSLKSELERHGLHGRTACSYDPSSGIPLGAHFELHIEQGPILQESGKRIGVVLGAQAYRWLKFTVTGRDAHTGTTPLASRKDPLLAAAKMIASSNAIAKSHGALASTGVIQVPASASTNTIASEVTFTMDIRHPDDHIVAVVQEQCLKTFQDIAREDGRGVAFGWTLDTDSPAAKFDQGCLAAVEEAATRLTGSDGWTYITSGAGHDSVNTSTRCPTAMIFVPCKDGVSHHPEEYCSPEDCALGAQALLDSVIRYDQMRVEGSKL